MVGCKTKVRERHSQWLDEATRIPVKYALCVDDRLTDALVLRYENRLRFFLPRRLLDSTYANRPIPPAPRIRSSTHRDGRPLILDGLPRAAAFSEHSAYVSAPPAIRPTLPCTPSQRPAMLRSYDLPQPTSTSRG